jgi:Peptidase_C39 like family
MTTFTAKIAAATRRAGLAAVLAAGAAATVVGFAGAAHAAPAAGMYGNPAAAARHWQRQHESDCAEMSVADVVGEITGHEPTEQQIDAVAENTPSTVHPGAIHTPPGGTSLPDIPVLLAHYGIHSTDSHLNNLGALEQDLAEGRKVIVFVNNGALDNPAGKWVGAGHLVVVTGIDTRHRVVHLNNSIHVEGGNQQVSIATFEKAWALGDNWADVTK